VHLQRRVISSRNPYPEHELPGLPTQPLLAKHSSGGEATHNSVSVSAARHAQSCGAGSIVQPSVATAPTLK